MSITLAAPAPPAPTATPATAAPPAPAVVDSAAGLRTALEGARRTGLQVGLVPTMGALHDGHRSLIERAARQCDVVVVSIFVNPTQFGDPADLAHYPRSLDADLGVVAAAGGHLVFAPPVEELYPDGTSATLTRVTAPALSGRWEGASRPGHFDGVATVVTKLCAIAGRCRAYFGEKDFQQLAVVTRVVRDLSLPVEIVGCPTVREADGLARSSRNARLGPEARRSALALSRALCTGSALIAGGEPDPGVVEQAMAMVVAGEPSVVLDYAAVVRAADLEPAPSCATPEPLRLLIAATVGPVRLIDNVDPPNGRLTGEVSGPSTTPPAGPVRETVGPGAPAAVEHLDVLVLGSGVAGLSAAVRLASGRVGVLTKGELSQSATRWAQGGVAAVLGGDEDSTDLHLADTLAAGADLCDTEAVRVLVDEGPDRVLELIGMGAEFDRQPGGGLELAREGGHSMARVVHAGGAATGAEVERALVEATRSGAAAVLEQWFALDLLVEGNRCAGVTALDASGRAVEVRATHTVLATGGAGQLFAVTTNPAEATADGLAMALRAGIPVADVEFMQFHPTALHHPAMPRPLLSEALRGHGALLRDTRGERFVDELAPRDVVSRAMAERMHQQGVDCLWLDATGLDAFGSRFPTIAESLQVIGLDPARDWLPIAPAAHYLSGGVLTDLSGATALPGLWAAGEVACTGVHGANRLASNSLLEGMVFGARLAEAISAGRDGPAGDGALGAVRETPGWPVDVDDLVPAFGRPAGRPAGGPAGAPAAGTADEPTPADEVGKLREHLQRAMIDGAGVVRSAASLAVAADAVAGVGTAVGHGRPSDRALGELANLVTVSRAVLRSAMLRTETRGAHARSDHPDLRPEWCRRIVHSGSAVTASGRPPLPRELTGPPGLPGGAGGTRGAGPTGGAGGEW